jgi:hypothetical protein
VNRASSVLLAALSLPGAGWPPAIAGEPAPIDLRVENLPVLPSTGPLAHVLVRNRGDKPFHGRLDVTFPAGWKMNKTAQDFSLQPGQTQRLAFAIETGRDDTSNAYPVEVRVEGGGLSVRTDRRIPAATAPYLKPVIDGRRDDWKDAVPVDFSSGGKRTTIHTGWSRRQFYLLVAVEEARHVRMPPAGGAPSPFDAVQIAVAPRDAQTPARDDASDQRHEFLLATRDDGRAACFTLYQPEQRVAVARENRRVEGLETPESQLVVRHEGGWTYYECSIPFKTMPSIQPETGREFCFSLLVHDPDGTGLRDWGAAAGLWPDQRNRLAWCRWHGAAWSDLPPFDNKIEWGLCSSKQ